MHGPALAACALAADAGAVAHRSRVYPRSELEVRKSAIADLRWLASLAPQGDGESESFSTAAGISRLGP